MKSKKDIVLLIFLIILFFMINYRFIDAFIENFLSEYEFGKVERVVDGDTLIINNQSVRLLGINAPERGEAYSTDAKKFLEELTLNKTARIEFGRERKDLYNRTLAYIFIGNENINLELVKMGFANFYFPSGKDIFYSSFKNSWIECIDNDKNLCKKSESECFDCIKLEKLDKENQEVVFYNNCSFDCDLTGWKIKGEGRKNFVFPDFVLKNNSDVKITIGDGINSESELFWKNQEYVWTKSGDTLFLRDKNSGLVLWKNY